MSETPSRRPRPLRTRRAGPQLLDAILVANFKSVSAAELRLPPLTVIAGANSSGKSSIIQALLFISQCVREGSIVLNGDLVKLGRATDVIRDGTDALSFDWRFTFPDVAHEYVLRVQLGARADFELAPTELSLWEDSTMLVEAVADDEIGEVPRVVGHLLRIAGPASLVTDKPAFFVMNGLLPGRLLHAAPEEWLRVRFDELLASARAGDRVAGYELSDIAAQATRPGSGATSVQPFRELQQAGFADLSDTDIEQLFGAFAEIEAPGGWFSRPLSISGRITARRGIGPATEEFGTVVVACAEAIARIASLANAMLYLGPLREDPRVVYPLGHTIAGLPVGAKGEFTAIFLAHHGSRPTSYRDESGTKRRETLLRAVSEWCSYLAIGEGVSVPAQGKQGYGFKLRIDGVDRDLTDIGVGASQLLPVVVLVLGASEGSYVLLEQPELHLHPAVQSRLADFFAQARPDISLFIETHSEYLITRLRRRVAEHSVSPELRVLFARQQKGETRFRSLRFNEAGDFEEWPEGFFDTLSDDTAEIARALRERYIRLTP
jgi:AAA domain, putative AbiEii toxin, Type IV TA system/AAA ATPase domain/Protein of unknown function (DUF3696)